MKVAGHDRFLLHFNPAGWTPAGRFKQFLGPPFHNSGKIKLALQTIVDHTRKYQVLASLANRLLPTLAEDVAELHANGHTAASRSSEFAAVVETLVCELYSTLDGLRDALFWLFDDVSGLQRKSTEQLFLRAKKRAYGTNFPAEIQNSLAEAYDAWFSDLRLLRTAFTHGALGSCHYSTDTGLVSYMNQNIGERHIPDIVKRTSQFAEAVFRQQAFVFEQLYARLDQQEQEQFCGFFKGRGYSRVVAPVPNIDWQSGRCHSRNWFDAQPEFRCPLASECQAYARASESPVADQTQVTSVPE
ncbi:hypothetical protein [Paraburkholderia strydomiana]|uniref:hypothetical protein n=1 Tax=Paraburkholderia strydomiana TaxID=1245417 RepID=UPI0038BB7067